MQVKSPLLFLPLFLLSCHHGNSSVQQAPGTANTVANSSDENPYAHISDIPLPAGYIRQKNPDEPFAAWLQQVPLKKSKTVYKFDGSLKGNQSAQFAVLDISVGDKNLQQCADAVMRLRAEYLYAVKQYDQILFTDNNGKPYHFTAPYTREHFGRYLETVFGMCGTASLSKQMKIVSDPATVKPGDVLVRGGFPGHAVIVMDMAENADHEKIYLLAQGFMPAQDIHVVINPNSASLSPWYQLNDAPDIETPEYSFHRNEWHTW